MKELRKMEFHCHTPNLLREIISNDQTSLLQKPINVFGRILFEVAERAAELNDPKLNSLMLKLTLYEHGDPEHPNYIYWQDYLEAATGEK